MPYAPPLQLQDLQIWTLVLDGTREQKVPEFYYTKRKMPLLTWPAIRSRYSQNPKRFAPVAGLVSQDLIVIDIDDHTELPESMIRLLEAHPTHHHLSKSGTGWKIYYLTNTPLPKKSMTFSLGDIYNGAFVTTTDPSLSDFSNEHVATIDPTLLIPFIPELEKKLNPQPRDPISASTNTNTGKPYIDGEKVLKEIEAMLSTIPVDIDNLLQMTYELKLRDLELNSYSHWLLVSHALADIAVQLSSDYPEATEQIALMFLKWSQPGQSFKSDEDTLERFYRSYEETLSSPDKPIVTFNTLRKLFWGYKLPTSDFPVVSTDKKGRQTVDASDPRNYVFLTNYLRLKAIRDSKFGNIHITGPATIIKSFFKSEQFQFYTSSLEDISAPFGKLGSDDDLTYRLITTFRQFGIPNATKTHPLTAGFRLTGLCVVDLMFKWMASVPWDGEDRVWPLITQSLTIDKTMTPSGQTVEFYHKLVFKHLIHMAGLRAKASRTNENHNLESDRFKRPQGMLILAGDQNTYKSTWIDCLLPQQASYVSNITPSGAKDTLELQRAMAGVFALNIDEIDAVLDTLNLSDLKNFITQDRDTYRTMYSPVFEDHPRAAGLFGTTNARQLKLDRTGNRRFWIIPVEECDASYFAKCDYQQVWAELLYKAEQMTLDEWGLTDVERDGINETARIYAKTSLASQTLDLITSELQTGVQETRVVSKFYDHTELDFVQLFLNTSQNVQRYFTKHDVFCAVKGKRAFRVLKDMAVFQPDAELNLASFNYDIAAFINGLTGVHNKTISHYLCTYRDGVITFDNSKPVLSKYHFLPFRTVIDDAIKLFKLPEKIIKNSCLQGTADDV